MIKPTGKRVIVEPDRPKQATDGGIHLPESFREDAQIGVVRCVGAGVTEILPGVRVLFSRYGGTEVNIDGRPYKLLGVEDVLGVFE